MAEANKFRPRFGGNSLIEQVIAAPLEAAARANSNMAHEQLSFLLKYCFEKDIIVDAENREQEKYTPKMVNIVKCNIIQDDKVFIFCSSSHTKTCRTFI